MTTNNRKLEEVTCILNSSRNCLWDPFAMKIVYYTFEAKPITFGEGEHTFYVSVKGASCELVNVKTRKQRGASRYSLRGPFAMKIVDYT